MAGEQSDFTAEFALSKRRAGQGERASTDGLVGVEDARSIGLDGLILRCTHDGKEQTMIVGSYNAWRLFALLAFLLFGAATVPPGVMKALKGVKL